MTRQELMRRAIDLAVENVANGGGPFGAVIAKDGEIVAEGVNRVTPNHDPTAHAEVSAIRAACARLETFDLTGYEIYTSCEPCPMCLGAIYWAHLDRIYYGANQHDAAAIDFDDAFIYRELAIPVDEREKQMINLLPEEALAAFNAWREKEDKVEY
ncbi:MAG: nucleoside deaminase [Bacteroidaceae bacterium]|nr:nucleoside deaminase [Bacteroidaceae bacterium]